MSLPKLFAIIIVTSLPVLLFARDSLEIIHPTLGSTPDFSREARADFARRDQILDKLGRNIAYEDLSPEEQQILDRYPETLGSIWDILGDGCSWYCSGGPYRVSSSSHLPEQGNIHYGSENAHDLNFKTAWVEGVEGYGVGEYLEYRFEHDSPRITQIIIYNGYVKSEKAWQANSRVKTFRMFVNDRAYALLRLQDSRAAQVFSAAPLGRRADGQDLVLRFEIADVYPGSKYDDTAVAELYFDGLDVHCFTAGTMIALADGSVKPIERLNTGDRILSYDAAAQRFLPDRVTGLDSAWHCRLVRYRFSNQQELTATADHPFWVAGKGWASAAPEKTRRYEGYAAVPELHVGDQLLHRSDNGKIAPLTIEDITPIHHPQKTYTITGLQNGQIFFAGGIAAGLEQIPAELVLGGRNKTIGSSPK